jgi:formate-dependent nitrite reductase membrane component NrfD
MDAIVLWQQKWSGDLFIPTYLFLGGLTAGLFIVAVLADLVGIRSSRWAALSRLTALAAMPVLALAGFFLTVHLGKPERGLGFPLFFTNYNSWMTRGGWFVGAGAPLVVVYGALWYFRVFPWLRRVLGVVGLPLLGLLGMYTGFLLAGAGYVPLWSRQYLPTLFLTSGITGGVALAGFLFLLGAPLLRLGAADARPVLRAVGVVLVAMIALEGYELREFMGHLAQRAPDKVAEWQDPLGKFRGPIGSRLAWEYVTGGEGYPWRLIRTAPAEAVEQIVKPRPTLAPWFWFGIVGAGLLLPLLLTLVEFGGDLVSRAFANSVAAVKFVLVLTAGYILRMVIVWGGDVKAPLPVVPNLWPIPGAGGLVLPPGLGG